MKPTYVVTLPEGEYCLKDDGKPCLLAKYARRWSGYNCTIYHKILKGGEIPRKCDECKRHCASFEPKEGT